MFLHRIEHRLHAALIVLFNRVDQLHTGVFENSLFFFFEDVDLADIADVDLAVVSSVFSNIVFVRCWDYYNKLRYNIFLKKGVL